MAQLQLREPSERMQNMEKIFFAIFAGFLWELCG